MDLKEAIKVVVEEEHLGDFVYTVRDRAMESDPRFRGNSWDHPRVARFSQAVERLTQELKK